MLLKVRIYGSQQQYFVSTNVDRKDVAYFRFFLIIKSIYNLSFNLKLLYAGEFLLYYTLFYIFYLVLLVSALY